MAGIPGAQARLWVSGVLPSIMMPGAPGAQVPVAPS